MPLSKRPIEPVISKPTKCQRDSLPDFMHVEVVVGGGGFSSEIHYHRMLSKWARETYPEIKPDYTTIYC
jgi:hypothetical protein